MKKIKQWLYEKFLPTWCREDLIDTNKRLSEKIAALRQENAELRAYIVGMKTVQRSGRKIIINTAGGDANERSFGTDKQR